MPSTTFYRKYRPQTFAEVVGQKHVVRTLTNALRLGRVGQAYLFTGPRGTGKTTLARLFAKAINCSNRKGAEPCHECAHCLLMAEGRSFDVIEIDAASHTGVDNIRELRETIALPPTLGSHKIYIIDEVHMLSIGAFNALLKTLEEPPAHVIFILATTALHKVPDTIISRCQRFDLSRFPVKSITEKLAKIAKAEKLKIDAAALEMIALSAEGGMRDAESLLMQIASLEVSPITEEVVIEILGTTKKATVVTLLRLVGTSDLYGSLSFVRTLSKDGADLSLFSGVLLHYLRDLLLVSADNTNGLALLDITDEQKATLSELARIFTPAQIVSMLEYFQVAQINSKTAVIAELPLEIAIVKILSDKSSATQHTERNPNTPPAPSSPVPQTPTAYEKKSDTKTPETKEVSSKQKAIRIEKPREAHAIATQTTKPEVAIVDIETVRAHWATILDTAKRLNASLTLALSTARPLETHGHTLVIAVKYPFHKERLDENANRLTLSTAFDSILGQKMKLSIVLEEAKSDLSEPKDSFIENPLMNQALEMLGGRVVPEG